MGFFLRLRKEGVERKEDLAGFGDFKDFVVCRFWCVVVVVVGWDEEEDGRGCSIISRH